MIYETDEYGVVTFKDFQFYDFMEVSEEDETNSVPPLQD